MILTRKNLEDLNKGKAIEVQDFYLERGFPRSKNMRISVRPPNRKKGNQG